MADRPYRSLPDWNFWKPSIAELPAGEVDPVVSGKFRIRRNDRIATAGSCFAQNIARYLQRAGFNYLITEPANPVFPADIAEKYGYGLFTARYGNIYTSRQLLQLLQRAYGLFQPADDVWSRPDGRLIDPFRPRLQPGGFVSMAEYDADRRQHFAAVRQAVETFDVLVFTLGLTEGWVSRVDGAAYPLCPGVAGGSFDPTAHVFVNLRINEVIADLRAAVQFVRAHNSRARFVLTVSPVPLVATAEPRSVLVSTVYSKSVLRIAAEEIARDDDDIAYFPSYEIITGQHARGRYFADDLRSVTEDGVARVMQLFFKHYADPSAADLHANSKPLTIMADHELERKSIARSIAVMCDEVALADSRLDTPVESSPDLRTSSAPQEEGGELTEAAANCMAAAERGEAEAQFQLGVIYCTGNGIRQDLARATKWYRLAAEQGHPYAAHNLAVMLLNGQGTDQDPAAAFQWSAHAAAQGAPEAQLMLGNLYIGGLGTASDPALARHWYGKAAAQGNLLAAANLRALDQAAKLPAPPPKPAEPPSRFADLAVGTLAIITMVYNESINLPIWTRHYRRVAPSAALFVIDHTSDDGSTRNLPGVNKIPLPRDKMDELDRAFFVNSLQQGFLRYYDIVIYTDCDELLLPDPAVATTLDGYLQQTKFSYASPIGINVIHMVEVEPPLDFGRPLLQQRRYGQFDSHLCKPVITRIPLHWEPGFHGCEHAFNIDPNLYLFHLKQIDKDQAVRRQHLARATKWSEAAVTASHGAHHRYDDERFVREFFVEPANALRQHGARPFTFEPEIARLHAETREISGVFHVPGFRGPIVGIPGRFRNAF